MKTKVMTFGSFDVIHNGHRSLFAQARKMGGRDCRLYVVVASDQRILKIKGRRPWFSQQERMLHVSKEPLVDVVVKGDRQNTLVPILKIRPDLIVFGYDQPLKTFELKRMLKKEGFEGAKILRAKPFKPKKFKSSLIKKERAIKGIDA
ncbi:MAG TPA: adenylyltransferase/cytidyltransferase family protein [Candidatus Norongarragalinales archaeon]|nr:adenylyltransferase/cytidyltransferase family protein [Candidatus Norongarragalinales archaeon]